MKLKIKAPPEWGIERVPERIKVLGSLDYFVLWSSLGVGLLVLQAGAFLSMPLEMYGFGFGIFEALIISLVGSVIGSILLALVGVIGARESIPTMVSLRPSFGLFGSYLPTVLNIIQLVGWASFELMIMGEAAETISGISGSKWMWTILLGIWAWFLAIYGPAKVVREWLEKFAIWIVYGSSIWITYLVLTSIDVGGNLFIGSSLSSYLLALDLVIAMPVSWIPLVSDYNRFASSSDSGFKGTFVGYSIANTWFYFLGALLFLLMPHESITRSIAILFFGNVALLLILVDETDNAFADIYSAAVSLQNILPRIRQWIYVSIITIVSIILALSIPLLEYEHFLLLIGASFVPVTSILITDYFVVKGKRYRDEELYYNVDKVNLSAIVSWVSGFLIYYILAYQYPIMGATIPTLFITGVIYYFICRFHGWEA
jgi:putative hydroxymethylpyrimidine transporter CytX